MVIAIFPVIAIVVGALMWGFLKDKASEAGKIIFFWGVGTLLMAVGTKTVHFG